MDFRETGSNISVVIRAKNSERTLARCLDSLKNQTHPFREIIVVENGSTDQTLNIARKYQCKIVPYPPDKKFNYSAALNLGIANSTGEKIFILSSHVILLHPRTLEWMAFLLDSSDMINSVSTVRTDHERKIDLENFRQVQWMLITNINFAGRAMYNLCSLIRKSQWEEYKFNEKIPRCEDQDWALHFMKKNNGGSAVIVYPSVLYSNPYNNFRKDLWDYIIMGRHIFPYYKSGKFIFSLLRSGFSEIFRMNIKKSIYYFRLALALSKEKFKKTRKISSVYHHQLNQTRNKNSFPKKTEVYK